MADEDAAKLAEPTHIADVDDVAAPFAPEPARTSPTTPSVSILAASPTSSVAAPPAATAAPTTAVEAHEVVPLPTQDSKELKELAEVFPDLDKDLLRDLLVMHGNDVNAAVLALSDSTDASHPAAESDEAYARRLQDEEHGRHAAQARQQQSQGPAYTHLAYQPRQSRSRNTTAQSAASSEPGQEQPAQIGEGKDELEQVMAKLSTAAESGKRIAGTWFSKIKTRVETGLEELEAKRAASAQTQAQTQTQARPSPAAARPDSAKPKPVATNSAIGTGATSSSAPTPTLTQPGSEPTGSKTDYGRLGLVPQQRISLVDDNRKVKTRDDDEESLEYTKSPFDDDD
ncbi:uncharacterized protein L969DRAFT_97331 [Mixia osmundae IAM 14324]|uniref:CUE domain-containing protein n=1 Tax=Mixia osmundae (strain CBS 9802 / IAM 14324 / JCM 22182 / KY 12970) TaxID=764103 RepID=G7DV53_MIXOS|nr:uncharacterized protein L969DRAFT_97331 [Mixia osmundae IAM 14324]KEI36320.1 hypothetical protein L969DRAFT_97331 [Mixia osmundae IAM 14324]GAA94463.1 hypothetical protein E5Q_01115 [Mixia osmundae IAM 14324]